MVSVAADFLIMVSLFFSIWQKGEPPRNASSSPAAVHPSPENSLSLEVHFIL
jgi:hypothetical protein